MDFKYVRIQGRDVASTTQYAAGVFSMCWKLVQDNAMDPEDAALFIELDTWFSEHLPYPEPCMRRENVICFFKTENAELMMKMMGPAMWLLERYDRPYYVVYTNSPGEIVYEDDFQIAVKVPETTVLEFGSWTGNAAGQDADGSDADEPEAETGKLSTDDATSGVPNASDPNASDATADDPNASDQH